MKRPIVLSYLFSLFAFAGTTLAQEPVAIRKKPLAVGNELSVEIKMRSKFEAQKWSPAGRNLVDTAFASDDLLHFTVFPLEFSKEGRLTRYVRHFGKAQRMQNGQPYLLPFDGRRFLYVEKEGRQEILSEKGDKLPSEVLLDLQGQSIPADPTRADWSEILPRAPVKVGDSWPIQPRRWMQDYEVDLAKAKATGTLKKVIPREGKQYGLIEYFVEVPLAGTRYQGSKLPIQEGSILRYLGVMEMNIDGTECYHVSRGALHIHSKARGPDAMGLDTRLEIVLDVEIIERCN